MSAASPRGVTATCGGNHRTSFISHQRTRKPYKMSPQKKKKIRVTQKSVHFHICAERSIKTLTLRGKSELRHLPPACRHPNTASLQSRLQHYTQPGGCINIISRKGQEAKPKVTLSSLVLLLGFLLSRAAVTHGLSGMRTATKPRKLALLEISSEASCSPKGGMCVCVYVCVFQVGERAAEQPRQQINKLQANK